MALDKMYAGGGGNKQRFFMTDARLRWTVVLADPNCNLAHGVTQYDYLEDLKMKLGGQARCILDNFLDKSGHTNKDNRGMRSQLLVKQAERCGEHSTSEKPSSAYARST